MGSFKNQEVACLAGTATVEVEAPVAGGLRNDN